MIVNLQFNTSCKKPEEGDVFISPKEYWPVSGYFTIVFKHPKYKKLQTIPLIYAHKLNINEFINKCSSCDAPSYIMPVTKLKLI